MRNKRVELKYLCKYCKKQFSDKKQNRKYCSASCKSKDGNFGSNENHSNWLGDNVGYWGIHKWVARHWGKPDKCERCEKDNLIKWQIHWANLDHKYSRDRNTWARLCQSCHAFFDKGKISYKGFTIV
jgi:hypothetical protein